MPLPLVPSTTRSRGSKSIVFLIALLAALGLTFALPAFASQISADSLVGYWKMDDGTGSSIATDSSGHGNNGTLTNGPTWSTNVPTTTFTDTRSLHFNGVNQYVKITNFNQGSTAVTVSAWIYKTDYNVNEQIVDKNPVNGNWDLFVYYNTIWWRGAGGDGGSVATAPSVNAWHHIAATISGTTGAIYIDGVKTPTSVTAIPNDTQTLRIGDYQDGGGAPFNGNIDDVRIYNRALAPWEIADLAAGKHPTAYWKGTNSTGFENAGNWSGSYVPDPYSKLVFPSTTNSLTLTGAIRAGGITVNTGALLILNGTGVTLNDGGTFTNYGTFELHGNESLTNIVNDSVHGTILLNGTSSYSSLPLGNTYHNLTINNGLAGYWKLDDGTGSTIARDSSGNGNNGTLTGGPTWSTSVPSRVQFYDPKSLHFDGTDDYVVAPETSSLDITSNTISFGAWVKPNTSSVYQLLVAKLVTDSDSRQYAMYLSGAGTSNIYWALNGVGGNVNFAISTPWQVGQWNHLFLVYNGSTVVVYLNGFAVYSGSFSGNITHLRNL